MILAMSDSQANQQAAAQLRSDTEHEIRLINELKQGIDDESHQLIILDVDVSDKVVHYLDPATFAQTLIKHGLSQHVDKVIFLVSDRNPDQNLFTFSRCFIETLKKEFSHEVMAYVPSNVNYQFTRVMPPTQSNPHWKIVGLNKRPPLKTLLWEGKNVLEWISTTDHAVRTRSQDFGKTSFYL